jgi:hypothetical protein
MRPVNTHTFCGTTYDIDFGSCYGSCDEPRPKNPTLWVDMENMSESKQLEILIHESLHASDWNKSEVMVTQTAKDISRFLWRLGYRVNTPRKK